MAKALQRRRGTSEEHKNFTGLEGEFTYDTTEKRIVAHDGVTKGGIPMAKKSEVTSAKTELEGKINAIDVGVTSFNGTKGAITYQAPVSSVNGQTGAVTVNVGVTSFNGSTGAVTYSAPVTSVNGQTGAVTLSVSPTWTQLSFRSATGSWTITGCTVGKPLYIVAQATKASSWCYAKLSIISGCIHAEGSSVASGYNYLLGVMNSDNYSANNCVVIPSSSTVTLNLSSVISCNLYAFN